jgi:hypothetical protein
VVFARHRFRRRFRACGQALSNVRERIAVARKFADARDERVGVRGDQETIDAVLDAFDERADARRDHGQGEAAQFRQRVAEGFGDGRQQQRRVGTQAREQVGQVVAAIVEQDVDAAFSEQLLRVGTGAEQEQLGVFAQTWQRCGEQLRALAGADAADHDEAQFPAFGWRFGLRRIVRPCGQSMLNHRVAQCRELWREAQLIGKRRSARRDERHLRLDERAHERIAQAFPVRGIAVREHVVAARIGEVAFALRIVERERGVAEIAMQRRPQRIVVVQDADRRQVCAQRVEAVADQRGDDDRVDAVGAHDVREQVAIRIVAERSVCNCARKRPARERRAGHRAVVQFQPFAMPAPREAAARDQHEVMRLRVGRGEVAHPALGAAAPAVQDVQDHGFGVEAGFAWR